ncbi:HNH endonuclease [Streptomyces sp. NBC_00343]|uniref:HNH endonuclease n=1 Tax=Streptomyces sp. NBC_00343 TaxID=2975719 RepID=UPI002E2A5D56|nr:hypothetical protein [Streptomyces sp. NBC_00343]
MSFLKVGGGFIRDGMCGGGPDVTLSVSPKKELIARLLADTCEICGIKGNVQVHPVRALADLAHAGWQPSDWARVMLHRRRETVVACDTCHDHIHSERPAKTDTQ